MIGESSFKVYLAESFHMVFIVGFEDLAIR